MPEEWVTKATGAIAVARLERVANALALAAHPGVVELVGFGMTGLEEAELRTVRVDAPTLAQRVLSPDELAGVVAAVATTVADLHEREVTHGAIDATHVLVPAGAGPRLCSFSGDPAARPEDDVAALGRLLECREDALDSLREALPTSRWRWRWTRPSSGASAAQRADTGRALNEIAARATDPDRTRRPTARALADLLHDRVPSARLPGAPTASGGRWRSPALLRRAGLLTIPVVVLGVAALVVAAVMPTQAVDVEPAPLTTITTTSSGASGSSGSDRKPSGVQVWPVDETACPQIDAPLRGDVDGDGCDEPLAFADGVIIAGAARLAVGDAGDTVATGDWNCDGHATLVLLRVQDQSLWHFPTWPQSGDEVAGAIMPSAPDAVGLSAERAGGCDTLHVERADGSALVAPIGEVGA